MRRGTTVVLLALLLNIQALTSRADGVLEWNALLLNAVRMEDTPPPLAARNLAILHVAIYDAVNAVDRRYQPYYVDATALPGTLVEAAAAAAAHAVMLGLYPSQQALAEASFTQDLAAMPPGSARDRGVRLGESVAEQILAWRSDDGASTSIPYIPSTAPGQWRRTAPFFRPPDLPQWPYVVPFAMTHGAQFRPPGPPALTSARYADDLNEVQALGAKDSPVRTVEQTLMATFWSDFSYTVTPPGHWNLIAETVAQQRGNSLLENARLFALLNMALADAAIACWDAKYMYNSWRPITAIQEADGDGNPDTFSDAHWSSFLNTPAFPEYPSGHSTFSRAAALVLADLFGTDQITFTVGSDAMPGVTRSFNGFSQAADEIGRSRIYGGIHFTSANLDGQATGALLARYVLDNFLLPLDHLPQLRLIRVTPQQITLQLQGVPSRTYCLEATTDFQQWFPFATNSASRGGILIEDSSIAGLRMHFYRARILP
jgi:hypothetical protein